MADDKQIKNTSNNYSSGTTKEYNLLDSIYSTMKDMNNNLYKGMREINKTLNTLLVLMSGIKGAMILGSAISAGVSLYRNRKISGNIKPTDINTEETIDKLLKLEKSTEIFVKRISIIFGKIDDIFSTNLRGKYLDPTKNVEKYKNLVHKVQENALAGKSKFTDIKDIQEAIQVKYKLSKANLPDLSESLEDMLNDTYTDIIYKTQQNLKARTINMNEIGDGSRFQQEPNPFSKVPNKPINLQDIISKQYRDDIFYQPEDSDSFANSMEQAQNILKSKKAKINVESLTQAMIDNVTSFENRVRNLKDELNREYEKTGRKTGETFNRQRGYIAPDIDLGFMPKNPTDSPVATMFDSLINPFIKYSNSQARRYEGESLGKIYDKKYNNDPSKQTFESDSIKKDYEELLKQIKDFKVKDLFDYTELVRLQRKKSLLAKKFSDYSMYDDYKRKRNSGEQHEEIVKDYQPTKLDKVLSNLFNKIKTPDLSRVFEKLTNFKLDVKDFKIPNILTKSFSKMSRDMNIIPGKKILPEFNSDAKKEADELAKEMMEDFGKIGEFIGKLSGLGKIKGNPIDIFKSIQKIFKSIGKHAGALLKFLLSPIGLAITGFFFVFVLPMFKELKKNMEKWFSYMEALSKSTFLFTKGITNQTKILEANALQASKIGLSQTKYVEQMSTVGEALRINGLTTRESLTTGDKILKRAADVGSFSNLDPQLFVEATLSAINGERERLKKLGVVINQDSLDQQARQQYNTKNFNSLARVDKANLVLEEIFKQTSFAADNFALTLNDSVPNMRKVIEAYKEENAVLSPLNRVAASMYKWWLSLVLAFEKGFNAFNTFINGMTKAGRQLNRINDLNNSRTPEEAKYRARDIVSGFKSSELENLSTYNSKLEKRANLTSKNSDAEDIIATEKAKGWWNSITSKSKRDSEKISKESEKAIKALSEDIKKIDETRSNIQAIANQIISGGLIMADFMAELNKNSKLSGAAKKAVENEIGLLVKADKNEQIEARTLTAEQKRDRYLNKLKARSQIVSTANTDVQNGSISSQTYANRINVDSQDAISLAGAESEFKRYRGRIVKGGSLSLGEQEEYDILAPMFQGIIEQAKQAKISAGAYIDKLAESVGKDNKELVGDMFLLTDNLDFITSELTTAQMQYQEVQARFDKAKTTKERDSELLKLAEQQKSIDLIEQQKNILLEKMDAISYAMEIALGQTLLTGVNNTLSAIETGIADITGILETGNLSPDKIIKMFSDFSKALLTGIEDIDKAMKTAQQRKNLKALGNAGENVTRGVGDTLKESGKGMANAASAIPIAGAVLGGISAIASIISSLVMQFDGNSFRKELKELNDKTEQQLSVMKDQLNILRSQQQYMDLQYRQQSIGRNVNTQEKLQRALEKLENSKKQTELVNKQYGSVKESDYIKAGADTSMLESVKLKYGNKKNFAWTDYDGIRNEMVSEYQRRGLTDTANMLKGKNLKTYSKGRDEFIKEIEEHAAREAETSKIKIDALENQLSIEEEIATLTDELNKSNASNLKNAKAITEELKKQLDLYKQIMGTQEQLAQIGLRDILNRTTTNEKPLSNKSYQFNSKEK